MLAQTYQVFARKYRPQKLSELIGQDTFVRTVSNAIQSNRVGHAYLFTGVRGVGKTSSARILAKSLNCVHGPTIEPCLQCQNCKEITASNSIDVVELDAASHTGVDNVREIIENSHYSPANSHYKIYIIDEVHMLSSSAFNALLKTLEEPPSHVKFIFATTEVHKIPMTILSRVQRFDFKKISRKDMVYRLAEICKTENCDITAEALSAIAYEGDGSMRDALSLLDKVVSFSDNSKMLDLAVIEEIIGYSGKTALTSLLTAIFLKDRSQLLDELRKVYQSNLNLKKFFSEIIESVRHALVLKTTNDSSLIDLESQDIKWLQSVTKNYSEIDLTRFLEHLLEKSQKFSISPYPHIVFELSLLQMLQIPVIVPVDQLIDKLDRLEKSLAGETNIKISNSHYSQQAQPLKKLVPEIQKNTETILSSLPSEWLHIITLAKEKNPTWSSALEQVKLIEFSSNKISLGFENLFVYDKFHNTDLKKWFENTAKETLSKNVIFQYLSKEQIEKAIAESKSFEQKKKSDESLIADISAPSFIGSSVFNEQQKLKEQERLDRMENLRKDPFVLEFEKAFSAKIIAIELFEKKS